MFIFSFSPWLSDIWTRRKVLCIMIPNVLKFILSKTILMKQMTQISVKSFYRVKFHWRKKKGVWRFSSTCRKQRKSNSFASHVSITNEIIYKVTIYAVHEISWPLLLLFCLLLLEVNQMFRSCGASLPNATWAFFSIFCILLSSMLGLTKVPMH